VSREQPVGGVEAWACNCPDGGQVRGILGQEKLQPLLSSDKDDSMAPGIWVCEFLSVSTLSSLLLFIFSCF
jgi:hypothetical protein